ncbi:flagellar biosynthetic protein FliR [Dongshaea marina]|uniref:flagellar biosynthetic protein FliR n=1 Tax=Dongshaea marina TaxID=2047966 RepID=UPI000D3EE211|nr:flagellar biosynthetic protein FliR [Dongshaea marina]
MDYLTQLIMEWLAAHLWPMARISGMLMSMVVIGSRTVSTRIRVAFVIAMTFVIAPIVPESPAIAMFSAASLVILAQQLMIGVAMGILSQILVQTFVIAGQMIAMQTSLGFATMVDPLNGQSSPVVGQFYLLLSSVLFLAMDGHLVMIELLAESFETLPISMQGLSIGNYQSLAAFFASMFKAGLVMALSASVAMLFINFSFGVMTRAAPQLNIFSIGFAINMIFGLFILWFTVGGFQAHFERQWHNTNSLMCTLIRVSC